MNTKISAYPRRRPNLAVIAETMGMKFSRPPQHWCESVALSNALILTVKGISKSQHLQLWANDALRLRDSLRYKKIVQRLSKKSGYHLESSWGFMTLRDTSFQSNRDFYWQISLACYPNAIIENPLVVEDLCLSRDIGLLNLSLDMRLVEDLSPSVYNYDGPGTPIVDEGKDFIDGMVVSVIGEENQVLSSIDVASGLKRTLNKDFDERFVAVVEQTKGAHRSLRATK